MKRHNSIIKDGKKDLNINIKLDDIRGAVCSDHQQCVIAKAIMRRMNASWVDVGAFVVLIGRGKSKAERYTLSSKAIQQVKYFDTNKGAFAPCTVVLKAPKLSLKQGARSGDKSSGKHKSPRGKNKSEPTR